MRVAASVVATLTALLSAQAIACSCATLAPMANEGSDAFLARSWASKLNPEISSNVFIATVAQNIGRFRAMTERDGDWPLELTDVEVLAGRAPPGSVVHNNNSCWARAPVASRIVVRTDESFAVSMCTVDLLADVPTKILKETVARNYQLMRRKE
jgi:hypothetical protein